MIIDIWYSALSTYNVQKRNTSPNELFLLFVLLVKIIDTFHKQLNSLTPNTKILSSYNLFQENSIVSEKNVIAICIPFLQ